MIVVSTYSNKAMIRAIIIATAIAGTLDILSAFVFAMMAGGSPLGVLRGVGSAIVDHDTTSPAALVVVGLILHFGIMLAMVNLYMIAASRIALLNRLPLFSGIIYGLFLWMVMYWIVLPSRWPALFPTVAPKEVAMQLFSHILLVGIPIALVARAAARWRFTTDS